MGVAFLALAVAALAWAEQKREVTGVLLQVDRENRTISVSCNEIPNYMQAMAMSFAHRSEDGLLPVTFGRRFARFVVGEGK